MKLFHRSGITKAFMLSLVVVLLVVSAGLLYLGLFYYSPAVSLSTFEVEVIEIINQANGSTTNGLAYVASTNAEQVQGFQNAQTLGNCNGILSNGTVAFIYQAQPESLKTVCQTAMYVLETNPSISISVGDRIILQGITH